MNLVTMAIMRTVTVTTVVVTMTMAVTMPPRPMFKLLGHVGWYAFGCLERAFEHGDCFLRNLLRGESLLFEFQSNPALV